MSALNVLLEEFPGDAAWRRFVEIRRARWQHRTDKDIYIAAFGDEDIAIVLAASMGQRSLKWFEEKIGALDQRSASDVLQSEPAGRTIIKTLLMRTPD